MRQAVWLAGRQVEISEERLPDLGKGDVRVRVRACGVCQTEVHAVDGVISQLDISALMGHEFSGEMIAVGNEVVGMPVACQASGGFAELVVVRADRIYPLPTGLWVNYGALVEPLACVIGALENAGAPAGKTVVITGAGPMGLLTLQLALRKRAAQIIVSGPTLTNGRWHCDWVRTRSSIRVKIESRELSRRRPGAEVLSLLLIALGIQQDWQTLSGLFQMVDEC